MKYQFEVKQTLYKVISVEAASAEEACAEAQRLLEDGEVRFGDEPFLRMECDVRPLGQNAE